MVYILPSDSVHTLTVAFADSVVEMFVAVFDSPTVRVELMMFDSVIDVILPL